MRLEPHLDKLRAFSVIADKGTMREASRILNVTQPALSRLVQTLEEALGSRLLHRSRNGVIPTEAGKILVNYSKIVLKNLEDVEAQILHSESQSGPNGHLHIGSFVSLVDYLWPKFIVSMRKQYPLLKLSIQTQQEMSFDKPLEQGTLDLVVDAEPRVIGDLSSWKLYEDKFSLYISRKLKGQNPLKLPIIYSPHAFDEDNLSIEYHLSSKGLRFIEEIKLDSFPSVAAFVRNEVGVGVLPTRLAKEFVKSKQIIEINFPGASNVHFGKHSIFATAHSGRTDDPRIKLLIKELKLWFKITK